MLTTTKSLRVLGFAGLASALALVQACAPNTGDDTNVNVDDGTIDPAASVTGGAELTPFATRGDNGHPVPPAGYVVKWSTCTHYVESDDRFQNNSRIVNAAADGTIPLQRVEQDSTTSKDNFRRVKIDALPKNVLQGKGKNPAGAIVRFVKLGQSVITKEKDGTFVQWVIGSYSLGNPVFNKIKNRPEYRDWCFRNPQTAGKDTAGRVSSGSELAVTCVVEESKMAWNALSAYGWTPLVNFATTKVGTSSSPHPDAAVFEGQVGTVYYYGGAGAALNDLNGAERDGSSNYIGGEAYCHMIVNGGLEVPGAKRPDTKTLPAPGVVNTKTAITWKPVNPNVTIANDQVPPPDPVEPEPEPASEPISADDTVPM